MRDLRTLPEIALLPVRAAAATRHAARVGIPGLEFASFGRNVALRIAIRNPGFALRLALTPVNIVRYFEFAFASSSLPRSCEAALDVGSPRLFGLFAASRGGARSVTMINPDGADLNLTRQVAVTLGLPIRTEQRGIETVVERERFDCVWALSVLEHLPGATADIDAVMRLYRSIRPGGRLVVTVPVDRCARVEYRRGHYYAEGTEDNGIERFFQRWYDEAAVHERLVAPTGAKASLVRWFGETISGRFAAYEALWQRRGHLVTVNDPREIADHYKEYPSWSTMPGVGVCGVLIQKQPVHIPAQSPDALKARSGAASESSPPAGNQMRLRSAAHQQGQ